VLVEPEHVIPQVGARVMDLQETSAKMSTSFGTDAGLIYIDDEPDDIRRKLKRAQTDSGREVVRAPEKAGISNLIEIYAVATGVEPEEVEREFAGEGYGAFKSAVGEAVVALLAPVRERYRELRADEAGLGRTLAEGADRARAIASPTMGEVHRVMGFASAVGRRV
jgi:tryptophanyl-tRNA synthetase